MTNLWVLNNKNYYFIPNVFNALNDEHFSNQITHSFALLCR